NQELEGRLEIQREPDVGISFLQSGDDPFGALLAAGWSFHVPDYVIASRVMQMRIGFIGLGILGKPMASNLLNAGFLLVRHNRSQAAVEELGHRGAASANSPADVASRSDVVITMLPDSPDVELVALGPSGLKEGVRAGQLFIDMSTINPIVSRKIAEEF